MLAIAIGLAAGVTHVLTGPDHLATVAPLTVEGRRRPWLTGFIWGVGHTSGFLIVGLLALVLQELLPWQRMAAWGDRMASICLVAIGLWGIYRVLSSRMERTRGMSAASILDETRRRGRSGPHIHVACMLGSLHGLVGSSHYLGVLPALAFSSGLASVGYLFGFGIGTIAAMVGFSWGLGRLTARTARGGSWLFTGMRFLLSLTAILVGGVWLLI